MSKFYRHRTAQWVERVSRAHMKPYAQFLLIPALGVRAAVDVVKFILFLYQVQDLLRICKTLYSKEIQINTVGSNRLIKTHILKE